MNWIIKTNQHDLYFIDREFANQERIKDLWILFKRLVENELNFLVVGWWRSSMLMNNVQWIPCTVGMKERMVCFKLDSVANGLWEVLNGWERETTFS